jgi:hypothetical protein
MPDESEIDPIFGDMSQYPTVSREELTPEEREFVERVERGDVEYVPNEEYVHEFVERFGYTPKIKEWNAFIAYALMDFDEAWRDAAIEVEHERP